jgi:hypothetical protein
LRRDGSACGVSSLGVWHMGGNLWWRVLGIPRRRYHDKRLDGLGRRWCSAFSEYREHGHRRCPARDKNSRPLRKDKKNLCAVVLKRKPKKNMGLGKGLYHCAGLRIMRSGRKVGPASRLVSGIETHQPAPAERTKCRPADWNGRPTHQPAPFWFRQKGRGGELASCSWTSLTNRSCYPNHST